jgi:hypothetical protein
MAKNQTRRLSPKLLQADIDAFANLSKLSDYSPSNADYSIANGGTKKVEMDKAGDGEATALKDLSTARDMAADAEWQFHNFMLGAKAQVIAQYGNNSNQLQSLGLKKKDEYKRPTGRKTKPD